MVVPFATRPFRRQLTTVEAVRAEPLPAIPPECLILAGPDALDDAVARATRQAGARLVVAAATHDDAALTAAVRGSGPIRHVRVVVDLRDHAWPAKPDRSVLQLHDLAFLAAAEHRDSLRDGGSYAVLLLDQLRGGVPHPIAALFTGMVRSLAWELSGCRVLAMLSDASTLRSGLAQLARETARLPLLPVIQVRDGQSEAHTLSPLRPAPLSESSPDEPSAIVAFGGGQGITAAILRATADRWRPDMWLLGSTDLCGGDGEGGYCTLADVLRQEPGLSVPQARRRLERHRRATATRATITELRTLCGADRVHYLTCDITNPAAVVGAVDALHTDTPGVDLVINAAGIIRSGALGTKSLSDFRAVRDLKALGYHNLKQAFAGRLPRRWCNFGSFVGAVGYAGETDYAAGNDYLAAAARYEHGLHTGVDEFTIEWPLWDEVGMGATSRVLARHEQQQLITLIGVAEGVAHFHDELSSYRTDRPVVTWLGDREVGLLNQRWPGLVQIGGPAW